MKTATSARRYLATYLTLILAFNVWASTATAKAAEFKGIWQVWHPYMLPFLSLLVLPLCLGYNLRVVHQFGRTSAVGKGLLYLNLALIAWGGIGVPIYGGYLTCAEWPLWQCSNPVGTAPAPGWQDVGTGLLFFPLFAAGLASLSRLVGVERGSIRRWWWLFVILAVINSFVAFPFGIGRTIPEWNSSLKDWVNIYYVIANVAVSGWVVIIAVKARSAAGGMFYRALLTVLLAAVISMVNNYLFTGVTSDTASDISIGLFGLMVLSLLYTFTTIGRVAEKMKMADTAAGN